MLLSTKQLQLPIKHFLQAEYSNIPLDFSLKCNDQEFKFNSYLLSLISQTISDLFISDPLSFEYKLNLKIEPSKFSQIIPILSSNSFKIDKTNYEPCLLLALELRSNKLLKFISTQYAQNLTSKEILKYSILAYNKSMIIPNDFKSRLAKDIQNLFLSGLIVQISQDEIIAISLDDENDGFLFEIPEYVGLDQTIGETPPGLIYEIFSQYSKEIHQKIRKFLIMRYTNFPPTKNFYLTPFNMTAATTSELLSFLPQNNFNYLRSFYVHLNRNVIQKRDKIDYSNLIDVINSKGIMRTKLRPKLEYSPPISRKYPIMNIFLLNDSCYKSETQNGTISFDFYPYAINLQSIVMIDPPQGWSLYGLVKPPLSEENLIFIENCEKCPKNTEKIKIIPVNSIRYYQTIILQQLNVKSGFSLGFIDFIGNITKIE